MIFNQSFITLSDGAVALAILSAHYASAAACPIASPVSKADSWSRLRLETACFAA